MSKLQTPTAQGESPEWITYDRWGTVLPNKKKFAAKIGPEEFGDVLKEHGGPGAEEEFASLMKRVEPLSNAAQALTSIALREDAGAILTLRPSRPVAAGTSTSRRRVASASCLSRLDGSCCV